MDIWEYLCRCFLSGKRMNWISRPIFLAVLILGDAGRTQEFKKSVDFSAATRGRQKLVWSLGGVCAKTIPEPILEGLSCGVCWRLPGHGSCCHISCWQGPKEHRQTKCLWTRSLSRSANCQWSLRREGRARGEKARSWYQVTPWKTTLWGCSPNISNILHQTWDPSKI